MGFFTDVFETFKELGKLSPEELKKGQRLDKNKDNLFKRVTGRVFYKVISKIKQNDLARGDKAKGLDTLTVYSPSDYQKMDCFLGINNSSGYCIKDGNELVSVFSSQKSSGDAIVKSAIKNGATHLDCFAKLINGKVSGDLYSLYSRNGFKIDKDLNVGKYGEPYAIRKGISHFVNDKGEVEMDNENVVVFMKL